MAQSSGGLGAPPTLPSTGQRDLVTVGMAHPARTTSQSVEGSIATGLPAGLDSPCVETLSLDRTPEPLSHLPATSLSAATAVCHSNACSVVLPTSLANVSASFANSVSTT